MCCSAPDRTESAREDGPVALGPAGARLVRIANGAGPRQAGDRHCLAPTRLPTLVDVEESTPARPTDGTRRHPEFDSRDGGGESTLGRAADPRRTAELGIAVCQSTVAKYMGRRRPPPS
jgi:hypothetical protein